MTWRATTTALLLDSVSQQNEVTRTTGKILDDIRDTLSPYRVQQESSRDDVFDAQVSEILKEALELDKEISKQTTQVDWVLNSTGVFDPSLMKHHEGESVPNATPQVLLVISPAMMKLGPSPAGSSSGKKIVLLKMEVSCEPA